MRTSWWFVVLVGVLGARHAYAAPQPRKQPRSTPAQQPAPPTTTHPTSAMPQTSQPTLDKLDAKSLMQSGLKLFAAKDFLGALAVFKTAYTRFPSAKILLNIGTTLTRLDRKAEAANVYQRYLDSPDADPAKRNEVKKVLAELDAAVAILELTITPTDSEIQLDDNDWFAAAGAQRQRVTPGSVTVRARHPDYQPDQQVVRATAGARLPITLALVEIPPPPPPVPAVAVDNGLRTAAIIEPPRSRVGALAVAHVGFTKLGVAGLVGMTVDVTSRLQAQAAAILGNSVGGYVGASFALLDGKVRPIIAAGVPIFASSGVRYSLRGAGGLELALSRHLAVIAEVGVEYLLNPEHTVQHEQHALFIPALGAAGRL